jgi:hypothetical protein
LRIYLIAVLRTKPGADQVLAGAADDRSAEVRLPMMEVSADPAACLDREIERRTAGPPQAWSRHRVA